MGSPLTKTRTVLVHAAEGDDCQWFNAPPDGGEEARGTSLSLDNNVWEDMERPTTITVTVEPGDKLNP